MGLTMTTSTNVRTPSINNIMLTQWCEYYKAWGKRTWLALAKHEITRLSQWSQKHFAQHHSRLSFPHHVHNE
jgi:hypothetical protein